MQTNFETIKRTLEQKFECCQQLNGILKREYTAISKQDIDTLGQTSEEKEFCHQKLLELEDTFFSAIKQRKLNADKEGVQAFFNLFGEKQQELDALWGKLINELRRCKEQNEINGRALNMSQSFTKQALSILSGDNQKTSVYTQDGKTDGDSDTQSIAIA